LKGGGVEKSKDGAGRRARIGEKDSILRWGGKRYKNRKRKKKKPRPGLRKGVRILQYSDKGREGERAGQSGGTDEREEGKEGSKRRSLRLKRKSLERKRRNCSQSRKLRSVKKKISRERGKVSASPDSS